MIKSYNNNNNVLYKLLLCLISFMAIYDIFIIYSYVRLFIFFPT